MHIEFLLEEPSTEAVLQVLIPKMMLGDVSFACHVMGGKKTLLKLLEIRFFKKIGFLPKLKLMCRTGFATQCH
ncbi:MAG: hypothetical protein ABFS56_05490 [Pseudomonadota bacterium]